MTEKRELYENQLKYILANDAEALIDNNYDNEATLINISQDPPIIISGAEALKEYFKQYLQNLIGLKVVSTDKFVETEDSIFFEASIETDAVTGVVYDAFYLKNGKIFRHYSGVKQINFK
jgi:hypothetical protein